MAERNDPVNGRGPTIPGVYDYWLGGSMHLRADRELGRAVEAEFPSVPAHVRAAKDFHLRVVRRYAEQGISRFVRAGAVTWQRDGRNVHEAALAVNPGARTVYVNRDDEACDWAQQLLAGPGSAAVQARTWRPAEVLGAPEVRSLLAPGKPAVVIIGLVLHFAPAETAAAAVADWARALPPGSVLAVSVSLPDRSPRAALLLEMLAPMARVHLHTAQDVAGWMEDAGLADAVAAESELDPPPPAIRDVRLLPGGVWAAGELHCGAAPGFTVGTLGLVR